jgi:hypothetical protein
MTELKEKITRPFAFLKISANPYAAHCQATQAHAETKALSKSAILPTHLVSLTILINLYV